MARLLYRAAFLPCLLLAGCSRESPPAYEPSDSEINLHKIARAYLRASDGLQHPPRNAGELRPYFDGDDADSALRSPDDGAEYVILWGATTTDLLARGSSQHPVLAYERVGKDGKRLVLQMPPQVTTMSAEELAKASFAVPHKVQK
jgi:hypothetical protein